MTLPSCNILRPTAWQQIFPVFTRSQPTKN